MIGDIFKLVLFIFLLALQSSKVHTFFGLELNTEDNWYYFNIISRFFILAVALDIIKVGIIYWYRGKREKGIKIDNFVTGVRNINRLILIFATPILILSLLKVDVVGLLTSLTIIAAALAILLKDYVNNIINGMIITFTDSISIGDQVKIEDHKGRIMDINFMNIHLMNDDDDLVYIPNTLAFSSKIINYTKREIKKTSIEFEMDLQFLDSVEALEQEIIDALEEFHPHIQNETFYLKVVHILKDAVQFKFQYILEVQDKDMERDIRRVAVRRVIKIIKDPNIVVS